MTTYFDHTRRHPALVSYWRCNDPAAATQAIDFSSHNSLNGAYSGSPVVGPELIQADPGAASRVFGTGKLVSVADIAQLRITSAFTLEAWVAPWATQTAVLIRKSSVSGAVAGPFSLSLNAGVLQVAVGNGTTQVVLNGPTVPVGIPSRVAGSLFRGTLFLCLNGTVFATTQAVGAQAIADAAQPLIFGNINGLMGEVAVYNASLSALRHARSFAIGQQIFSDPSHFVSVDPPVYS